MISHHLIHYSLFFKVNSNFLFFYCLYSNALQLFVFFFNNPKILQNSKIYFKTNTSFFFLNYNSKYFKKNYFFRKLKFKFFKLFWINSIKRKQYYKNIFYSTHHSLFINPNNFLKLPQYKMYLVGLKITPRLTNFKWKKKWFVKKKQFLLKINKSRKKLNWNNKFNNNFNLFFKNTHNSDNYNDNKYLYYSFFFKLFKLNINFKDFKYSIKKIKNKYPIHFSQFKFSAPYLFINISKKESKTYASPLFSIFTLYKFHRKTFKAFKKMYFFKTKKFKNYFLHFSSKNIFLKKANQNFLFFNLTNSKTLPFFNANFSLKFKNFLPYNVSNSYIADDNFNFTNNKIFSIKNFITSKSFLKLSLKKTIFKKKFRNLVIFKRLLLQKNKLSAIKNNSIMSSVLLFKFFFYKLNSKNLIKFPDNDSGDVIFLTCQTDFSILNKNNNLLIKKIFTVKTKSINYSKPATQKNLWFSPIYANTFVLNKLGFLFLTCRTLNKTVNAHYPQLFKLKKVMYSFSKKNDLPKFILKKYSYYKLTNKITKFFKLKKKFSKFKKVPFSKVFHKQSKKHLYFNENQTCTTINNLLSPLADSNRAPLKNFSLKLKKNFIKRSLNLVLFKFKPGYMKQWRTARADLRLRLPKTFRYQHQLTAFLTVYKKAANLERFLLTEMQLINVLKKVRFVFDSPTSNLLISNSNVFVNSVCYTNPFFVLMLNDFVQLIISFKYYILFKWLLNSNNKIKSKINKKSKLIKKKKDAQNPDKKYRYSLPQSVVSFDMLFIDIAKYVEIDFFTLSFFILYNPFLLLDVNKFDYTVNKYLIYNMYNWKYIT